MKTGLIPKKKNIYFSDGRWLNLATGTQHKTLKNKPAYIKTDSPVLKNVIKSLKENLYP